MNNPLDPTSSSRRERDDNDTLAEPLRAALRGLQRDTLPAHDLFPGIAARIADAAPRAATPLPASPTRRSPRRRPRARPWLAAAAMLALAVGIGWQLRPTQHALPPGGHTALMVQEADRMAAAYRSAWSVLDAQRRPGVDAGALHQIDASAAQVRAALEQDPDARFLFNRLQSLYSRRLDLAQRFAYPS